jgi:hypothetical protein
MCRLGWCGGLRGWRSVLIFRHQLSRRDRQAPAQITPTGSAAVTARPVTTERNRSGSSTRTTLYVSNIGIRMPSSSHRSQVQQNAGERPDFQRVVVFVEPHDLVVSATVDRPTGNETQAPPKNRRWTVDRPGQRVCLRKQLRQRESTAGLAETGFSGIDLAVEDDGGATASLLPPRQLACACRACGQSVEFAESHQLNNRRRVQRARATVKNSAGIRRGPAPAHQSFPSPLGSG